MNSDKKNNTELLRDPEPAVKSLDELIEILDKDELRNVVGGFTDRPKGKPGEY